jgi:hypothetical protein
MKNQENRDQLRWDLLEAWNKSKTSHAPLADSELQEWLVKLQTCLEIQPPKSRS